MTIATYSDLQSAVSDRLARSDMSAGAPTVAECITLAEAELRRRLRTRMMETLVTTFPVGAEYVPTPSDFVQVRDFALTSSSPRVQLKYLTPEMQTREYPAAGLDIPVSYSIVGTNFRFAPIPDATYLATLVYFAKIPALVTYLTNWLLTEHPDAYLYGSLVHAGIRLQNPDLVQGYQVYFDKALAEAQSQADRARWSGPGLATVPDSPGF